MFGASFNLNRQESKSVYAAAEIALLYGVIYAENCIRIYRYWVFVSWYNLTHLFFRSFRWGYLVFIIYAAFRNEPERMTTSDKDDII